MIEKRTIGLNFTEPGYAGIVVWAPMAQSLKVVAPNETFELNKGQFGFWELNRFPLNDGDMYSLELDGKQYADPASLDQPDGVHGYSRAYDLQAYKWTDNTWKGAALKDLIIYELHIGTFTPEGTLDAIHDHLPYLKELGINAIEIMPLSQFPGDRNWGYDGVFPFAVHNSYGGAASLQRFVDICHLFGIAVILDVVYNHLGPEGNYLYPFGPYFTDKYKTPWGNAVNFDDAWCDGVRMYYIENALMWLRDFHIDGLRLDAIHAIKDFSPRNILLDMQIHTSRLNEVTGVKHFLIGECDLNDVKYVSSQAAGGYDLDAIWCDEFHHALHALCTGEKSGYYADFGSIGHISRAYNDAFVYNGVWSEHRKKKFGNKTTGLPGHKFVVFIQNHDQIGNRMNGNRLSSMVGFELLKTMAGALFFSPFIPLIFMGEEYAETSPFQYFTSHTDKDLIMQVREGRKKEFEAFYTGNTIPDPQSESTFLNSKLNRKLTDTNQTTMLAYYKELIRLRRLLIDTGRQGFSSVVVDDHDAILLHYKQGINAITAVLNFTSEPLSVLTSDLGMPADVVLNSSALRWKGPGTQIVADQQNTLFPASSIVVMRKTG